VSATVSASHKLYTPRSSHSYHHRCYADWRPSYELRYAPQQPASLSLYFTTVAHFAARPHWCGARDAGRGEGWSAFGHRGSQRLLFRVGAGINVSPLRPCPRRIGPPFTSSSPIMPQDNPSRPVICVIPPSSITMQMTLHSPCCRNIRRSRS